MKVAAIIPAHNEEKNICKVVEQTLPYVDMLVVVDDGSKDGTYNSVLNTRDKHVKVHALHHPLNLGKGAALKTGSEYALENDAQILIYLDADGQHNPNEIPRFLKMKEEQNNDIVFGSRKIGRDMPLVTMLGNKFLSILSNLFFGVYISDTQSGYRLLTASAYKKLVWESSSYAVETEMISKIKGSGLSFSEITIDTIYKDNYKGTTVIDGIRIFLNMIKWKIK